MAVGWEEILLILIIILILFGPQRLPKLARSIGEAVREFKEGMKEKDKPAKKK